MATGTEIINYRGDAGKALAGAPGALAVVGDTDATQLSQTARDLAIMSFNKNQMVFKQKIADRDAAFKLLDDDELIPDQILEDDRDRINGKLKKLQDIFYESNGDIMSDPRRYRDFIRSVQDAKNDIKQAQKWYVGEVSLLEEKSKNASNPIEQRKYDEHLLKQREKKHGNFYAIPDPYVKTTDFDLTTVAAKPVATTATVPDGEFDVTTTTVDPRATFDQYQKEWSDPKKNHWFGEYVDMFLNGPKAKEDVARINGRLQELNKKLGLSAGDAGFITDLGVKEDPLNPGSFMADSDRADQIAAKIALADSEGVKVSREFAAARAKVNVDREELRQRARDNAADRGLRAQALAWDKDKWAQSQKGGESVVNAAGIFAKRKYDEIEKLGSIRNKNGETILTPDDIRKMNAEQLKYLGVEGGTVTETDDDGTVKTTTKGLVPFQLAPTEALVLKDGVLTVMSDVLDKQGKLRVDGKGFIHGNFNPSKTRTIGIIGTNRLNEQVRAAGAGEFNAYQPMDLGEFGQSVNERGGSQSQSGGSQSKGATELKGNEDPASLTVGATYILDGQTLRWDGKNLVIQK